MVAWLLLSVVGGGGARLWRRRLFTDSEICRVKILAAGDRKVDVMYVISWMRREVFVFRLLGRRCIEPI